MRKVLQEFPAKLFILSEQIHFLLVFFCPLLNILSYFVNASLWQYVFIIYFFFFCSLGLVNKFINEFYFPVDKSFKHERNQQITSTKNDNKSTKPPKPVFFNDKDQQA